MQKGSLVKFDFTASLEEGNIIDTTVKEVAEKNNLKKDNCNPMTVLLGEDKILKGLEEAILSLKVGEEKDFSFPPEKAFGQRNASLVRVVPINQFRAQGMKPFPGMTFTVEGMRGKVQSVSGGRVRVDFNPELAGKTLKYKVKVVSEAKTDEEKAAYLFERVFGYAPKVKVSGKEVEYEVESFSPQRKKLVEDLKKVLSKDSARFVETVSAKKD